MGRKRNSIAKVSVDLDDDLGSACHLVNICRSALWGIVESLAAEERSAVDVTSEACDELKAFDLPVQFGKAPSKRAQKRKRNEDHDAPMTSARVNLPLLPRNMLVPHDNLAVLEGETRRLVSILGVGPAHPPGSYALVRCLCSPQAFQVCRSFLVPLSHSERESAYVRWEEDFYYQMALSKPSDLHEKYWDQRYRIFSMFDHGARLDLESWYSVTYEVVAKYIASQCSHTCRSMGSHCGVVLDCFSGCGGCTIPLALLPGIHVVAVDMDREKLKLLRHNATLYGAEKRISFVQDDVLRLLNSLAKPRKKASLVQALHCYRSGLPPEPVLNKDSFAFGVYSADVVVLSPPWGGPAYLDTDEFDLTCMLPSGDCFELVALALCVAPSVVAVLPRNSSDQQLKEMAATFKAAYRIEDVYVSHKLKLKLAVFGALSKHFGRGPS